MLEDIMLSHIIIKVRDIYSNHQYRNYSNKIYVQKFLNQIFFILTFESY